MKFDDFVNALYAAGWRRQFDDQNIYLRSLWRKLWPVIADLEDEMTGNLF